MSRSKKPSRRKRASPSPKDVSPPGRRRRYWLFAIGIAAVVVAVVYRVREDPRADYIRAEQLLAQQPQQCEQLAELAVMKAGGDYPAAQLLQCRALAALGEWDAALGGFSLIKDTTSCAPESLLELGAAALEADQLQLAGRTLEAARVPGPFYSRATELLVRLQLELDSRDEALALCREWQAAAPNAALPWVIAAEIEVSQFELAPGIADYQDALRRSPSGELEKRIRAALANLLVHTGDLVAARIQFDKLLETGPVTGTLQLDYVQLLRLEGRFKEALAEVERYLATAGKNPEALKRRGLIRMDLGQLDEALADLQAAVAGNEFDIATHHLLAQVYLRQGKPDLAQPHLEQSRRLSDATFRISELKELLLANPTSPTRAEWTRELKVLNKVLGH